MPSPPTREKGSADSRRSFLKRAINGLAVLAGILLGAVALLSLSPRRRGSGREEIVLLGDEDDAPRRGAREMLWSYEKNGRTVTGRVILVQSPEGLIALSPSCTHLGCFVVWREEEKEFTCPCHGGRYDSTGRNISGPPPAPLGRFAIEKREGKLYVRVPA